MLEWVGTLRCDVPENWGAWVSTRTCKIKRGQTVCFGCNLKLASGGPRELTFLYVGSMYSLKTSDLLIIIESCIGKHSISHNTRRIYSALMMVQV